MPEPSEGGSPRQKDANRIARRTFRQRPKLVGTTADGEPVYEVRSVRLVLRGGSPAFNRIVTCERCGQDQVGAAVLSQDDLDAPARPMICAGCIRRAGVSGAREPEPTSSPPEHPVPAPPVEPAQRESIEHRLQSVAAQVEELIHLEAQLRRTVTGLAHLVEAQRVDLTAVVRETARVRTEVPAAVDRKLDHLAAQIAELSSRMEALVSRTDEPSSTPAPPPREEKQVDLMDTLELQLQKASERLSILWESAGGSVPRD